MRDAVRGYYENRTVYGEKLVYFGESQLHDEWHDADDVRTFETMIPHTLHVGQPMTVTIQVNKSTDERVIDHEVTLIGTATAIGDHSVELTLNRGERAKLAPLLDRARKKQEELVGAKQRLAQLEARVDALSQADAAKLKPELDAARRRVAELSPGARKPIKVVDADRLIAWQLYWRGENFWAGGEIWPFLPEMKTSFPNPNNVEFNKYINDRARAPIGRRYFVVTEAGRISGIRSLLPTPRGRESFEVLETTSNKFSLGAFDL
jgi:hypothetical protein